MIFVATDICIGIIISFTLENKIPINHFMKSFYDKLSIFVPEDHFTHKLFSHTVSK
jgi:hypothetical protein